MHEVGWDVAIDGCSRCGTYFPTRDDAQQWAATNHNRWYSVGPVVLHGDVPTYSTDIAAAWEVVEKIARVHGREAQFTVICRTGYSNSSEPRGEWIAGYRFPDAANPGQWRWSGVFGYGEGTTAPLAICRAAMKAIS